MYTDEQIQRNITNVEKQLLWNIYQEMKQLNALLARLTNENDQYPDSHKKNYDSMKRPQLMKEMSKLSNKPSGFNRWETEKMRNHLKGMKEVG